MALFLIARNVDLDYSQREECRSKVDALVFSLPPTPFAPLPALSLIPTTHTRVHPERHFYQVHHMHAYSYGCPRRLNYGLSSRARTSKELADRSRRARCSRSVPPVFLFFFRFLFSLPPPFPHDTRENRLVSGNVEDANEEDPSPLSFGRGNGFSDSFSLMKESSVRLCN